MEMFWKLLCACLVAVIIWKLWELFRVNVGKHGEGLAGVNVSKLGIWFVGGILSKLGERWVFEPIARKIESIARKVLERLVKGIRLVEKIVYKVEQYLVEEIGNVEQCLVDNIVSEVEEQLVEEIGYVEQWLVKEIGFVFNCEDNTHRLKEVVDRLRVLEGRVSRCRVEAAKCGEEIEPSVTEWQKKARSALEEAIRVLEDAERACKKRYLGFCPDLKALYRISQNGGEQMQVYA